MRRPHVLIACAVLAACNDSFVPSPNVEVSVLKTGTGSGRVTAAAAGIDCGTVCQGTVPRETFGVVFTQVADSGNQFSGWSQISFFEELPPLVCGRASTCTMGARENISLVARFDRIDSLHLAMSGTGSGSVLFHVTGEPERSCSSACALPIPQGAFVFATAQPASGSTFVSWTGPISCTGSCSVAMSGRTEIGMTWGTAAATRSTP